MNALLIALFAASFAAEEDTRDVVKLKAGGELQGRVVFESADKVVLRASSRERTIPKSDVASISSVARSTEEWLERRNKLAPDDVAGRLELAQFCKDRKLDREAALEALVVLRTDPKNEKAHEILKHRRAGSTWFVSLESGEVAWSLVDKSTEDWGKAFRVDTEHYSVRTNAGVVAAVDLALDLETFYSTFFQVFGDDLEAREILEPMTAYAYRNKKEWPSSSGHIGGYFDPAGRIMQVYFEQIPGRPRGMFHEASHALLFTMFQREQSGKVPSWVDEGFAEFFDAGFTGPPGKPTFTFDATDRNRFAELAGATKSAHLTRIINYQPSDFAASSNQMLKYVEVYTLIHFLLHADNESYRPKLAAYLKDAFKSKASAGVFEKAMGKDLESIEKAWRKYVAEKAK
jgi:uncharacterized protein DUF1570